LICGLTRDAAAVLLRVFETTPGRGAAFSCGVFRTAGAAEAGGGRRRIVATLVLRRDWHATTTASGVSRLRGWGGGYGFRVRSLRTG